MFTRALVLSQEGRIVRDGAYAQIVSDRAFLSEMNII
jgi:hypothetical protein